MDDAANHPDVWQANDLKLDGSRVIDRRVYVDETVFEAEQEKLFARTWQWIGHESEVPNFGDFLTATIAGRPIVVVRGEDDAINAFYNTCTHRGAIVANGRKGNCNGAFTCLYHAWSFDTEGKLVSVPRKEAYGSELEQASYDIPRIRLERFAGNIFINLDPGAQALEEYLGAAKPHIEQYSKDWEVLGRVRWSLDGNWKLWHENFRDNYHPMYAHQALGYNYQGMKEIAGDNFDLDQGHSIMPFPAQGNPENYAAVVRKITGRPFEARRRGTGNPDDRSFIMAIFPNLDFQAGALGGNHSVIQVVRPISIDKAYVEIIVLGPKGEAPEARQARLENALDTQTAHGKISGDDTEAARRCNIGFGTISAVRWSNMGRGQAPGGHGEKNDEYSLRAFYSEYKKYLGSDLSASI